MKDVEIMDEEGRRKWRIMEGKGMMYNVRIEFFSEFSWGSVDSFNMGDRKARR